MKTPWRRAWQFTPVFLPGESHGQRSLAGYSPRGRKESDTTEQLSTVLFKQLVCDTGLTRQVVGEQRPGGKGLRVSGARNRMHKGPAVGFSFTALSTVGHSVLPVDLISFSALLQGTEKSAYCCVLSCLAHSELGDNNLLN